MFYINPIAQGIQRRNLAPFGPGAMVEDAGGGLTEPCADLAKRFCATICTLGAQRTTSACPLPAGGGALPFNREFLYDWRDTTTGGTRLNDGAQPAGKTLLKEREMLKGLGGLGDMAKMMKTAQEMQTKMAELQEQMAEMTVSGESGAGLVKATASLKGELKALDIDPSILGNDDKEVVEDLILAAIKDVQAKAEEAKQEEMSKLTESLGIPKDMKLPF